MCVPNLANFNKPESSQIGQFIGSSISIGIRDASTILIECSPAKTCSVLKKSFVCAQSRIKLRQRLCFFSGAELHLKVLFNSARERSTVA